MSGVVERIRQFIDETSEDIDRIIVNGDDWNEVKEAGETVGEGFDTTTKLDGVVVRWDSPFPKEGEPEARIEIAEGEQ